MRFCNDNLTTRGKLLKTGEAAQLLHVTPQTVRDWTDSGKLESHATAGGHRNYYEADVKRLALEEKGISSYFILNVNVALDKDGNIHFLDGDFEVSSAPETLAEVSFASYWEGTNGMQRLPHRAVLNSEPETIVSAAGSPVVFDVEKPFAGICAIAGYEAVYSSATVVGFDPKEMQAKLPAQIEVISQYLKENFSPRVAYQWFDKEGKRIEY